MLLINLTQIKRGWQNQNRKQLVKTIWSRPNNVIVPKRRKMFRDHSNVYRTLIHLYEIEFCRYRPLLSCIRLVQANNASGTKKANCVPNCAGGDLSL